MSKPTTEFGAPVVDDNNIQTAGPRGPALLEDVWFLEKLAHFDGEVIPERRSVNPVPHRGDAELTHQ
jgi:catalase